jgi:hypothetical protein
MIFIIVQIYKKTTHKDWCKTKKRPQVWTTKFTLVSTRYIVTSRTLGSNPRRIASIHRSASYLPRMSSTRTGFCHTFKYNFYKALENPGFNSRGGNLVAWLDFRAVMQEEENPV